MTIDQADHQWWNGNGEMKINIDGNDPGKMMTLIYYWWLNMAKWWREWYVKWWPASDNDEEIVNWETDINDKC